MRLQKRGRPDSVELARSMRKAPTDASRLMWAMLRRNALDGLHFRREHEISGFYVDFYCAQARLAVEVDGDPHFTADGRDYDAARTIALNVLGIEVLRFENRDVLANPRIVEEAIRVRALARIAALAEQ